MNGGKEIINGMPSLPKDNTKFILITKEEVDANRLNIAWLKKLYSQHLHFSCLNNEVFGKLCLHLGRSYQYEPSSNREFLMDERYKFAVRYYQQAVKLGDLEAHYELAELYDSDPEIVSEQMNVDPKDERERLLTIAAQQGHFLACYKLGSFCKNEKRYEEALTWYVKVLGLADFDPKVRTDVLTALCDLPTAMLEEHPNLPVAEKLFEEAKHAYKKYEKCWQQDEKEQNFIEAFVKFSIAAALHHPEARCYLAMIGDLFIHSFEQNSFDEVSEKINQWILDCLPIAENSNDATLHAWVGEVYSVGRNFTVIGKMQGSNISYRRRMTVLVAKDAQKSVLHNLIATKLNPTYAKPLGLAINKGNKELSMGSRYWSHHPYSTPKPPSGEYHYSLVFYWLSQHGSSKSFELLSKGLNEQDSFRRLATIKHTNPFWPLNHSPSQEEVAEAFFQLSSSEAFFERQIDHPDCKLSLNYLEQAAKLGHVAAKESLFRFCIDKGLMPAGYLYEEQSRQTQDMDEFRSQFITALVDLCLIPSFLERNHYPLPFQRDAKSSIELLEKWAGKENSSAQYLLGWLYLTGEWGGGNFRKAQPLLGQAAQHGLQTAHYYLGLMCHGESRDKALNHYQLASSQFPMAQRVIHLLGAVGSSSEVLTQPLHEVWEQSDNLNDWSLWTAQDIDRFVRLNTVERSYAQGWIDESHIATNATFFKESLKHYKESVKKSIQLNGHLNTHDLAWIYLRVGRKLMLKKHDFYKQQAWSCFEKISFETGQAYLEACREMAVLSAQQKTFLSKGSKSVETFTIQKTMEDYQSDLGSPDITTRATAYYKLGSVYFDEKKYAVAHWHFDQAIQSGVLLPDVYNKMGWLHEFGLGTKQDYEKALFYYEQNMQEDSENVANHIEKVEAKIALVKLAEDRKQEPLLEDINELVRKTFQFLEHDPKAAYYLGVLYQGAGDINKAMECFSKVTRGDLKNDALMRLAQLKDRDSDKEAVVTEPQGINYSNAGPKEEKPPSFWSRLFS